MISRCSCAGEEVNPSSRSDESVSRDASEEGEATAREGEMGVDRACPSHRDANAPPPLGPVGDPAKRNARSDGELRPEEAERGFDGDRDREQEV